MKALYLGHQDTNDGKHRIFLARENDNVKGYKPVLKYADGIGLYFPKVDSLPNKKLGTEIEYFFDESGKIIFPD